MKTFIQAIVISCMIYILYILYILFLSYGTFHVSDNFYKKNIVKNNDLFIECEKNVYSISLEDYYYDSLTLYVNSDTSYVIALWGDRESILWNLIGNRYIYVSLSPDNSNAIHNLDTRILGLFKYRKIE